MSAPDRLEDFINTLEKEGDLVRISEEVDPNLEITEIADRCVKNGGPALIFENPKGSDIPLAINLFASERRMALALGVDNLREIADRITDVIKPEIPTGFMDKLAMLPKLKEIASAGPKYVNKAPCQNVVLKGDEVDLTRLPVLTCWPEDGGPFITLGQCFSKSPVDGRRNIGLYRLQVYDRNTTGMHFHPPKGMGVHFREAGERGERLPVSVAIGTDPTTLYSATAPVPDGIDELLFAGFIRKKPVTMVKCVTNGLEVPAESQIVLEGYVEPGDYRTEGPFGDHTGYYSLTEEFPVFHVEAVTMKKNPIYAATVVGPPPMEDAWLGKATERIFLPLLKMVVPEVIDYNLPVEGGFHNMAIVSINKRYAGHARKVMNALWGLGQMMVCKVLIIVDADVDVHDYQDVAWKVLASIDPERDMQMTIGPVDILDHASRSFGFGSKVGIDATRKWKDEGFSRRWPNVQVMDEEVKQRVDAIWNRLGISLKRD